MRRTVSWPVRELLLLDNVVDANKYIPAVPKLREAAQRVRRIGLCVMGMGDLAYTMQVRYGSRQCIDLVGQVMEFVRYHAMVASIEVAKTRGPFPRIKGSIYDADNITWKPPTPLFD